MANYDIAGKPTEERMFTVYDIADIVGRHKTTILNKAHRSGIKGIFTEGKKTLFTYLEYKAIIAMFDKKEIKKSAEADTSLITDKRCLIEGWFPDPTPDCLKGDEE